VAANTVSFSLSGRGEPFGRIESVANLAVSIIFEAGLWDALVLSVRELFDGFRPPDLRRPAVIVAGDPLLGLATTEALFPGALLPFRNAERGITHARLPEYLGGFQSLHSWREDSSGLSGETGPLVIRAWDSPPERVAVELSAFSAAPDERSLVCLMKTSPGGHGVEPTADVSRRAQDIVAAAIERLNLLGVMADAPHRSAEQWVDALIDSGATPDRILASLNTFKYHDFYRRVRTEEQRLRPLPAERANAFVLNDKEEKPRHAASLFLAAHFPALTSGQFVDLADTLASHTPASTPPDDQSRPPREVTDVVLRQCGIYFVPDQRGGHVAVIGADVEEADDTKEIFGSTVGSVSSDFCRLFERDAALLKERYLTALAMGATLGHASEVVADRYRELEIEAMHAAAALDPEAARERLRRIVFGYPAFLRANDGYLAANRRGLEGTLRRAVSRAPRLIEELAARVRAFQPGEALRALCDAEPVDTDADWPRLFREACARLFWLVYVAMPDRVSLADFPAFLGRGGAISTDEARLRREAALSALRIAFDNPEEDPLLARFGDKRRDVTLLTTLLHTTASEFPRLHYRRNDPFGATLFGDIALQYLTWGLRGKRWHVLPAWPNDLALAMALSHEGRVEDWSMPERRVATRYPDHAAAKRALHGEGRLSWLTCILILDGLVASAGFGEDLEPITWNILLFQVIGETPEPNDLALPIFSSAREWELLCLPDPDETCWLGALPEKLLRMFPVLLLMAATRDPGSAPDNPSFRFSDPLKEFLRQAKGRGGKAWLDDLREAVQVGRNIQNEWGKAVNRWIFPRSVLDIWRPAFRERANALAAFQRALDPLRREISLRPVAGTAPGANGAESVSKAAQPAAPAAGGGPSEAPGADPAGASDVPAADLTAPPASAPSPPGSP
jgi:hypothetical protein